MNVTIHDDHEVDDNEKFEIQLSHDGSVGRIISPDHIGNLNNVTVTIRETEG